MATRDKRRKRALRTRSRIAKGGAGRMRLSVFRSARHISAQIIDDAKGTTLASASSLDAAIRGEKSEGGKVAAASRVGKTLAERASAAGVKDVVFDRGPYLYHGRVRALAEAAREGGLNF